MRTLRKIGAALFGALAATAIAVAGTNCIEWSSTAAYAVFLALDYGVLVSLAWSGA